MVKEFDLMIVGGGPAGLTAGIYASRSRLKTAIVEEKRKPGGQVATTWEIENYPGLLATSGPELMKSFSDHAQKFGCEIIRDKVLGISIDGNKKCLKTKKDEYFAKSIIIATGAQPRSLGIKGESEFTGRGVAYCAICDADFYTDRNVIVLGNGDAAVEEAIYLTRYARKVTIVVIHQEGKMDATKVLQEKAYSNPKIDFIWNSIVLEIKGEDLVEQVVVKNIKTGEEENVETDGLFVLVGTIPNSDFLRGRLEMTEEGYIKTNELMETSIPGIFAAGDVTEKFLRQVVTSCADGSIAAIAAEKYIEEEGSFYKDVLLPSQERPVIVLFWSPKNKESMKLIEEMEMFKNENKGSRVVYIDTYKNLRISERYRVETLPEVKVFERGDVTTSFSGRISGQELSQLKKILSKEERGGSR